MEKVNSAFGRRVGFLMAEKGVDPGELAKRIGILSTNVCQLRRSKRPRPSTIHKVAKAFGVPVSYFFSEG